MTEKEKMLSGELYDCGDAELQDRWHKAKDLERKYSSIDTRDKEGKIQILKELLGSIGENSWISPPFHVDYGDNIYIGNNVEINMGCTFLDCNRITIGDSSGLGPGVQIYAVGHPIDPEERLPVNSTFWRGFTAPVTIGRNVWIGGGSIILPGVTIGDNSTIGAGSVVTKSIPPNVVAVGNPCRIIKKL